MKRSLAVLAAVVSGVALRLSVTWTQTPDCLYHLRRARFALAHFPRTIIVDPLMNFPKGGVCIWPPLFDLALALPALLLRGPHAAPAWLEISAQWVPIAFAAGAVAAAAWAGEAVRRGWGVAAGFFVALCPGHLQYSQFGHTDQHVAESCWGFLALALFLWSRRRDSAPRELAAGIALTLAVLTWQGAIFWGAIFAGALAVGVVTERKSVPVRTPLLILGVPATLCGMATAFWTKGWDLPFTYVSFGWFQPVFLSAAFAGVLIFSLVRRPSQEGVREFTVRVLLAAGGAAPAVLFGKEFIRMTKMGTLHLISASTGSVEASGEYLSYPKEWLAQIIEYRPLFADRWDWPFAILSFAFFLSPILFAVWARRVARRERPAFHAALLFWGVFTFLFTLAQRRNIYYGALLGAVAAVELSAAAAARLRRRMPVRGRRPAGPILFGAIFLAFAAPMLFALPGVLREGYSPPADLRDAMAALGRLMPPEVDAYDARFLRPLEPVPELGAAHSVMVFWSQGHFVEYFSERPVVANNFGYNFFDSVKFFLAESEEDAVAIAHRHRVGYVVALDLLPVVGEYERAIGRPPSVVETDRGWIALPVYFRTIQGRMIDLDGKGARLSDGTDVQALSHFRLCYASAAGSVRWGRTVSTWKIFQVVE